MSHAWDCPTDYEARSAGRRDAEDGFSRHRYRDDCPEAHETYERAYRSESYRLEMEAEERRAEAHHEARRREEDAWEDQMIAEGERLQYEAAEREHYAALERDEYLLGEARVNADADPPEQSHPKDSTHG